MASTVTCEELIATLRKYSLVSDDLVTRTLVANRLSPSSGAEPLLNALLKAEHLTKFQFLAIRAGKARGLVLRDYLITEQIAKGGMGVVYRALHRRLNRVVAIKVLPQSLVMGTNAVSRFEREMRLLASLDSPYVVRCFDAGEANGVRYMVTEFVEGVSCEEFIASAGHVTLKQAMSIGFQASLGLAHAHQQGIVHRDVKPANLMIDMKGQIKVLDLGVAGLLDEAKAESIRSVTAAGVSMGTVDYMSPEQAIDAREVDQRSDVYSLGCTLHCILAGEPPFRRHTMIATILAHRSEEARPLSAYRPDIPARLQVLISRMLSKKREDRPSSMREIAVALQEWSGITAVGGGMDGPASGRVDVSKIRNNSLPHGDRLALGPTSLEALAGTDQSSTGLTAVDRKAAAASQSPESTSALKPTPIAPVIEANNSHRDEDQHDEEVDSRNRRKTAGLIVLFVAAVGIVGWRSRIFEPSKTKVTREAASQTGALSLVLSDSNANVSVSLNGRVLDSSTWRSTMVLPAGEYILMVTGGDYATVRHAFHLDSEQVLNLRIDLTSRGSSSEGGFKFQK